MRDPNKLREKERREINGLVRGTRNQDWYRGKLDGLRRDRSDEVLLVFHRLVGRRRERGEERVEIRGYGRRLICVQLILQLLDVAHDLVEEFTLICVFRGANETTESGLDFFLLLPLLAGLLPDCSLGRETLGTGLLGSTVRHRLHLTVEVR
ncbi:hypothetical protein PFISCL1PPCAC_15922 [Pristionchus fissidentatus]|uniref:Uncharacterized protein n=1 Tax=Pristionchus fissidentatus TaxID=1538716 RepID=A0AAV5W1N2_9BILA|nr:hypothetical protein PFISCL1PPCAC_15922 [Pristionchus fissidentatus]